MPHSSHQLCSTSRAGMSSQETSCELDLLVTPSDHGTWTCMVTMAAEFQFQSIVTRLGLSVMVKPKLRYKYRVILTKGEGTIHEKFLWSRIA